MAVQECPPAPSIFLAGYCSGLAAWITIELDASETPHHWAQCNDKQQEQMHSGAFHAHALLSIFWMEHVSFLLSSLPLLRAGQRLWDCSWWPTGLLRGCRAPLYFSCLPEKTEICSGQWISPGFHASLHILIDVTLMTSTLGKKNAILGRAWRHKRISQMK